MSRKSVGVDKPHVRVYRDALNSPAWRALGGSAVKLFMDMRASLGSTNNGNLDATLSKLKHRGWRSENTLAKAKRELEALGFIARTRSTIGVEHGSKTCNLYRFTDKDAFDFPLLGIEGVKAGHDYLRFATVADAERTAKAARPATPRKKSTVQKVQRDGAESAPIGRTNGAVSAFTSATRMQKVQCQKKPQFAETSANTGFAPDCATHP